MDHLKYQTDEEIIQTINSYLNDSIYNYALLIDGQWGCGKTYFIKNKLIPHIQKEIDKSIKYKKAVYISLYGLSDIKSVATKILFATITGQKNNKIKKSESLIKNALNAFGSHINLNINDLSTSICDMIDMKKNILILDDLERCHCDVAEVLGLINNMVEHNGLKVIIIANEAEIDNKNQETDPLQYLIAKDEAIVTPSDDEYKNNKKNKKIPMTPKRLSQRTEEIFTYESNYERIKEKLIGHTIQYHPNLKLVIKEIIDKSVRKDSVLYKQIIKQENYFAKNLTEENYYNLRTFHFYLEIMNKLDKLLNEIYPKGYEDVLDDVIIYCFHSSIKYKKGNYAFPWKNDTLLAKSGVHEDIFTLDCIQGFAFVDHAIFYDSYDKEIIQKTIGLYREEKEKEETEAARQKDPSMQLLTSWWDYTDKEVKNAIKDIKEKLEKHTFDEKQYPTIIYTLLYPTVECGFDITVIDDVVKIMIKHIQENKTFLSWNDYRIFVSNDKLSDEYQKYANQIMRAVTANIDQSVSQKIDAALQQNNWGELLYASFEPQKELQERSTVCLLDVDKIIDLISKSTSKQINMFQQYIAAIYSFSNINDFYKKDIGTVKKLLDGVGNLNMESCDKIKQLSIQRLIKLLEEKYHDLNRQ